MRSPAAIAPLANCSFPHVPLVERHRPRQRERFARSPAGPWGRSSPAPAQPPPHPPARCRKCPAAATLPSTWHCSAPSCTRTSRDGARRRPHAHGNARALERRPRRRGRAQHALAVAHDDLAVRPQVNQRGQALALVQPRRQQPGQDVAAHEASQARQETHRRIAGQDPAQLAPPGTPAARATPAQKDNARAAPR